MISTTGGRFYQLLPEKENTEEVELEMFSLFSSSPDLLLVMTESYINLS